MDGDRLEGLDGCPYSIPSDPETLTQLDQLNDTERDLQRRLRVVRERLVTSGLLGETRGFQRTREIYESNAIEGLGPSIGRTHEILRSWSGRDILSEFDRGIFTESIMRDPDLRAVLGIHGAKVLADRLMTPDHSERPMTEADIRSLHEVIAAGESYAGRYKRFHITISQAEHEPLVPIDTPAAMHELVGWINRKSELPAILRAAVAHAWLTHIHPFEDGNGRLARLLANLLLSRADLPPAIVKHRSERENYISTLAHSDVGGDIFPFAGLVQKTITRYMREVEKPGFLRKIFVAELRQRGQELYDWWWNSVQAFTTRLAGELFLSGISGTPAGSVGREEFNLLRDLDSAGNSWYLVLKDEAQAELLIWFGYPSWGLRQRLEPRDYYPTLFFSVRNDEYRLNPYRKASSEELGGLTEVMVVPDLNVKVHARIDDRTLSGGIADSAELIAEKIVSAFRSGRIPARGSGLLRGRGADGMAPE